MKKLKILIMTDGNFLAHATRVLEIGKVLRDSYNFDVVFAGTGSFMRLAQQDGFETDHLFTVSGKVTLELAKSAGLVRYSWWKNITDSCLASDIEAIERHKPDLIMADMRWSAGPAARKFGIPYISLTNAAWTNYYAPKLRAVDDHYLTRILGEKLSERTLPFFKWLGISYWGLPMMLWQLKHAPFAKFAKDLFDIIEGDLTLLADIPEYFPTKDMPKNFKYVGPILWQPDMDVPEFVQNLDPERPTVYVTMGSTGHGRFFEYALEIFGDTEYQVVMTTGNMHANLPSIPDNFYVVPFAPGLPILQKSSVTINHSGNGSVYQALKAGTPIVGIPTHVDQAMNVQRIEDLGVGVKLRESVLTPQMLKDAVDTVITDPQYKRNAVHLSKVIDSYNGPMTAARMIHQFCEANFAVDSDRSEESAVHAELVAL